MLAKYMGASHYAYNLLNMMGTSSVIMIYGSAKLGVKCDKQSLDLDTRVADLDLHEDSLEPKEDPSTSKLKKSGEGNYMT